MATERYEPRPVPEQANEALRTWLEEEISLIAYWLNLLLQYNEDNP